MATNMKLMKEIHEQFLICKICYEPYKNPKTLTCLHTFCSNCLQKHIDAEQERTSRYSLYARHVYCPICRKKTEIPTGGIRRLPDNFLVSSLTDVVNRLKTTKVPPCEICHTVRTRSNEACTKCLECSKLMCKSCVKLHLTTKVTQNHSLFDLEGEKDIECKSHTDEIVRFYCEHCDECICVVCTFQEHRDHEICSFNEGSAKYRSTIETLLGQCKERLLDLRVRLGMIGKCESALKDTRDRIRDLAISYISQVRQTEKQLLQKVDAMFGDEILDFLENKSWLQENFDNLQNTSNLAEIIMKDKGIEILLLKKELQKKLGVLLEPNLPKVPEYLATDIKFVPGFVKLGHIAVPGGEEEVDANSSAEKDENNTESSSAAMNSPSLNRSICSEYKNVDIQTDSTMSLDSSTTMFTDVNTETAASQTSKIETVSRLNGTENNHTRNKSTEVYRVDPKTRGTMTEELDKRTSMTGQTQEKTEFGPERYRKTVPLCTKSIETILKFSLHDDFGTEDIEMLQRAKKFGYEARSAPKTITRCRRIQTDLTINALSIPPEGNFSQIVETAKTETEDRGVGDSSVLTGCASINTDKIMICDRKVSSHLPQDAHAGSCSPVHDRKMRRLSGDILAIRQRFGETKPLRRQDSNGKQSPPAVEEKTVPQPTSTTHTQTTPVDLISCCAGPDTASYRNSTTLTDSFETQDVTTDTLSLQQSYITSKGTSTETVQTRNTSTEAKPTTEVVGVNVQPICKEVAVGNDQHFQVTDCGTSPQEQTSFASKETSTDFNVSPNIVVDFADACTETDTLKMRDSETSTSVLATVDNWTLTNQTEYINSGTSPVVTPTKEVGISTLTPILISQGMSTTTVECVDSETETNLFVQDNETLTDRIVSTDAQTNIHVHSQDSQTWVDCSDQFEAGTMTETGTGTSTIDDFLLLIEGERNGDIANISEVIEDSDQGPSEEEIFFELPDEDDDDLPSKKKLQWGNAVHTMTLPDAVEKQHDTALCNKCCLQKPVQVHRSTMSSPTPTHDQGTMVLSFNTSWTEFTDRNAQTIQATTADKSIEAAFSEPTELYNLLATPDYNDVATSTESLPYMGLLSEVDLDELYLVPNSAFELLSDTDTANSDCDSDPEVEMVDGETWMENCQSVEAGTQTPTFITQHQSSHQKDDSSEVTEITAEMLDDGSKHLVSIGVNTAPKVTYEKETSTQTRYLFSKGSMTFYINKSDKSTGSNRSSIASRNSLLIDRVDKDTMTSGKEMSDKAVSTDSAQLNEQVAVCISKLKNVHEKLQSPTSKNSPETDLSPKSTLARKNKPQMEELLGASIPNPCSDSVTTMPTSTKAAATAPTTLPPPGPGTKVSTSTKESTTSSTLTGSSAPRNLLTGSLLLTFSSTPTSTTTTTTTTTTTATATVMTGDTTTVASSAKMTTAEPKKSSTSSTDNAATSTSISTSTVLTTSASSTVVTSTSSSASSPALLHQHFPSSNDQRLGRSDRVTLRKAQPITTLKCRYKDQVKCQSLPRQFSAPTGDPQFQQQQQQTGLIRLGSQMTSPPSRLPLLRYNSAPGRIVTIPKQAPPKDFSSPQTSPKSTTKIPTTRKLNESQMDTIKDYYTITNAKPSNQLPSLPAITETRTPSSCSDSSGVSLRSNMSGGSINLSSLVNSASATSQSPSSPSSLTTNTVPSPSSTAFSDDASIASLSPTTTTKSSLAVSPLTPSSSRECSPQTRKAGFMQRLLTRKPKKENDSSKRHRQRPNSSVHSLSSSSSNSSALSLVGAHSATPSPKTPPRSTKSAPKPPSTVAPSTVAPSTVTPSNSAPSSHVVDEKTAAKPKKNHPFVYMRQRIFAINHDIEDTPERRARVRERNQKKNEKKMEKKKPSPPISDASSGGGGGSDSKTHKKKTVGKKKSNVSEKTPAPIKPAPTPTPVSVEGQSFADVC